MDQQMHSQQLSQMVEKEVRTMIGDLQMQIIVLRSMLNLQQGGDPGQPGQQPNPNPQPAPQPGRPGPSPDFPTPQHTPVPEPVPGEQPRQGLSPNGRIREAGR